MSTSTDLLPLITEGIQRRKGKQISIIDLSTIETAAASTFVICQGTSNTHVASIADSIREYLLEEANIKPYNYSGYENAQWIVIDYGHTLVHIFTAPERERYNLEELWSDATISEIPDLD
ncbi:MAG: ribosome silencing factor [Muribaculaceae bacterium]|nr:ribosome silencing factor [Muribaculaceae bacterium]